MEQCHEAAGLQPEWRPAWPRRVFGEPVTASAPSGESPGYPITALNRTGSGWYKHPQ
jgi:hypothetical protein